MTEKEREIERRAQEFRDKRLEMLHMVNPNIYVTRCPSHEKAVFVKSTDWSDVEGISVKDFRISVQSSNERRNRDIVRLFNIRRKDKIPFPPNTITLRIGNSTMPLFSMTSCIFDDYIITRDVGYLDGTAIYVIEAEPKA